MEIRTILYADDRVTRFAISKNARFVVQENRETIYFRFFQAIPASPIKHVPIKIHADGSGTGANSFANRMPKSIWPCVP
jgi:hypothetical protein